MKQNKAKPPGFFRIVLYAVIFLSVVLAMAAYIVFRGDLQEGVFSRAWNQLRAPFADPEALADTLVFDAHLENQYAVFGNGLAVLSPNRLVCYAASGRESRVREGVFEQPALAASPRVVVGYDRGGNTLIAMNDAGVLWEEPWPGVILSVCAGERGEFAVVAEEPGYKAAVTVFDTGAQPCYKYYSATHYLSRAALSPDGKLLAAAGIGFENDWVSSRVLFFALDQEEPLGYADIPDALVLAVYYLANDRVSVICEDEILFFDESGVQIGAYRWENRVLLDYMPGPGERVTLRAAQNTAGSHSELLLLDDEGRLLRQKSVPADVLSQSSAGRYAAFLSSDRLTFLDQDFETRAELPMDGLARMVLQRSDGSAFLLESDRARMVTAELTP